MNELAQKIQFVLTECESGDVRAMLKSKLWLDSRQQVKRLITELEVSGYELAAARVDREYCRLAEAMRGAVLERPTSIIKNDLVLSDLSREMLESLHALDRLPSYLKNHKRTTNSDKGKRGRPGPDVETLGLRKKVYDRRGQGKDWADIAGEFNITKQEAERMAKAHEAMLRRAKLSAQNPSTK